jgi:hypothetical protein
MRNNSVPTSATKRAFAIAKQVVMTQGSIFIRELLRKKQHQGSAVAIGATKQDIVESLVQAIRDDVVTESDLDEWVQKIEGWGRQHAYLFHASEKIISSPALRSPRHLQSALRDSKMAAVWGKQTSLDFPDELIISRVIHPLREWRPSGRRAEGQRENPIAALEWENLGFHEGESTINEFAKLQEWCNKNPNARFACLIGYAIKGPSASHTEKAKSAAQLLESYTARWTPGPPLLLVVIEYEWHARRIFSQITMDKVAGASKTRLRQQPAYPWAVIGSRWASENSGKSGAT